MKVENNYIFTIANGVGAGQHDWPVGLVIKVGTTLIVKNADTTSLHTVHYSMPFMHQADPGMTAGNQYAQTPLASGDSEMHCHAHAAGSGNVTVTIIP